MRSPIYSIYTCLCVVLQLNFAASVNFKVGDPSETELSERRHQDAWDTLPDVLRETHLPSERSYGGGSIVNQPAMAQIIGENKVLNDLAEDLMFEGDIYLSPLKQNNAVTYETWLWPNGIVPYEIDSAYDSDSVANIEEAISQYHQHTCIQFVQRTTQEDYVYIYPGNGCYSSIGRDGGRQPLSLGYGCTRHPVTTMHELMHAVGFFHEQSRTDRDDYVYILWQNIQEEHKHNFERHEADYINDLGASYDYFSIMHYSHTSFTIDGQSTILPTQDSGVSPEDLGSSLVFTVTDLYKLNRLYNCDGSGGIGKEECGIEHRLSAGSSIEIMSPNHPGNYDDNADCTWTVINRDGGTVRLEFVSFDTEIQYDYVQFGSGSYPNTDAERHDGNALPSVFNSQSETAWITFRSDSSNVMTGFKLSATAIGGGEDECGGSYELGEGSMLEISSPNYPNNYGNNLDCFWKFTHFSGGEIKFRFTNLDTEPRYDYVQFGDGSSLDQNAAKHSGITTPADTTLSGGEAWVLFHSDETATMTGFQLRVEGLGGGGDNENVECGGNHEIGEGSFQLISSPNYPGDYGNDLDCIWIFTQVDGGNTELHFTSLDTEPNYDYVEFGAGSSPDKNGARHSGNIIPSDVTFSSGMVWVLFHSDQSSTRPGFELRVSGLGNGGEEVVEDCGGHNELAEGVLLEITSPNYPNTYGDNLDCVWTFSHINGGSIEFKFIDFETEVVHDFVQFGSGDVVDPSSTKHQGSVIPSDYTSSGSAAWLSLHTDASVNMQGFRVRVMAVDGGDDNDDDDVGTQCGGNFEVYEGEVWHIETPYYPTNYVDNLDCTWMFTGMMGTELEVRFRSFDTEAVHDYLQLGNGNTVDEHAARYSGNTLPDKFVSQGTRMWMTFHSDGSVNDKGFRATVSALGS